ncbi:MAG: serine/threonine protein kinase, partial [Thermoguttaceae bacterium]|nr:serine/threonine protein kinase [Thermoguttaceae bacterium]
MIHPKKLGPFRIVQVIGRGGMGAVYKAVHEETHQVVALKVAMQLDEESDQRARFEVEIETLKKLRHPNIVRLYGFGQEEGLLYYAMEYVDGPSLQTLQKKKRFFTWEEVVHIGIEVCDALKHAHDRGIIHRDIKPANILLLKDGSVKVSDYGIAHFFGDSRLTGTDMVIGTIEFMSPEQAQAGPLTPKSDIYSLGALLYTLITGFPPYQAKTLPEILQKYKYGPPESIRFTRPEVPQILDLYIMELLRIQPEKRPANARIISRRLEAIRLAYSSDPDANPFLKHQNSDQAPIFPATDSAEHRGETDGQYPYSSNHFAHSSDQFIDPSTRKPGNYQELSSQSIEIPSPETSSRKNPEPTLPANNDSRYDFPFSHNSAAKPSTAARPAGS